jgi:hypothetical protein
LNHRVTSFHILHRMTNGTRCVVWREQVCSCSDLPGDIVLPFAGRILRPLINSDCDDHSFRHALTTVFSGTFAKVQKTAIISFVMSVCVSVRPHGRTRLPLDRFSLNLIFVYF